MTVMTDTGTIPESTDAGLRRELQEWQRRCAELSAANGHLMRHMANLQASLRLLNATHARIIEVLALRETQKLALVRRCKELGQLVSAAQSVRGLKRIQAARYIESIGENRRLRSALGLIREQKVALFRKLRLQRRKTSLMARLASSEVDRRTASAAAQ